MEKLSDRYYYIVGQRMIGDAVKIIEDDITDEVAQLEEKLRELDTAIGEAFKDYPYENESGIKKITLQSFAFIQRIRRNLSVASQESNHKQD